LLIVITPAKAKLNLLILTPVKVDVTHCVFHSTVAAPPRVKHLAI
jgi:hypothetical protein